MFGYVWICISVLSKLEAEMALIATVYGSRSIGVFPAQRSKSYDVPDYHALIDS